MRVIFLIDGFNLYHSIADVEANTSKGYKWLNVKSLMEQYLQHIDKKAYLEDIFFFTAIRYHVEDKHPESIKRHQLYLELLKSTGIKIIHGKFKKGDCFCKYCRKKTPKHEEKETDVNIAVKLVELAFRDLSDVFVIVSGDTDLIPAIEVVKRNFPDKKVYVIFPYNRRNNEVQKVTDGVFKIKVTSYERHQFSKEYSTISETFKKPSTW